MTRRVSFFLSLAFTAASLCAATTLAAAATPNASSKPAATKPAKPLHISQGATVKLSDYLVPGKTVVFDFFSAYCGPCLQIAPELEKLHARRADVVVVKVDINRPGVKGIDFSSPVAQQFNLYAVPHFKVYGPTGKLIAEDTPVTRHGHETVVRLLQ